MSFYIAVRFTATDRWHDLVSSASHMMETIAAKSLTWTDPDSGISATKKLHSLRLPNGDIYDFKTGKWTQTPRNRNFI